MLGSPNGRYLQELYSIKSDKECQLSWKLKALLNVPKVPPVPVIIHNTYMCTYIT